MNFNKIANNTNCNCFLDAQENLNDTFVRKVRKSDNLNDADFRNHIERNKTATNENDCQEVCGLYGVSVEIWNDSSRQRLLDRYLTTLSISPKTKNNLCVIQFRNNNGLVKYTPDQVEYNEFHYDFFKEDSFTVSELNLVEMIPLSIT
ncbi:hypothetical protein [Mucilaginibacter terrae]|uniref:Uncharacterized protein n=1 Tax=Mucilaginibacter terrae TaxID=1955052 RepID=A0ABU3GPG3_9SPHI|nr:hypothetical protein [Mucilaginibacter terrae]MDT3401500.1 hypothetical protein [Mucilaginibacter terrae]